MGMLFDCSTDNIGLHLKNIFASGELEKNSVTEKISATESDGKKYMTQLYKHAFIQGQSREQGAM